ncbi:HEAT repeat domain-containing protein [Singulisphaera sp. GP187]|uniref:HEAT repeat domain-containing protein n=1 Tax=Singulisphaera sp. GP187 TaxID=1882752 RepID=UPI0020B1053C|nr:HEAT repeat domain-containing protein [Singulisphaera sp. GP187]
MCRNSSFRDRLAISCVVASLAAGASFLPGVVADARGQVPGPETFSKEPQTPLELWEAADYLLRTGQVQQAVPYLNKFMKSKPDDAVLLQIRDRYGVGSVLRLDNYPETRVLARPLSSLLAAASLRSSTRPDRIQRFVNTLTKSAEEQEYALERLREAGPYAVPYVVQALDRANLPAEERALIAYNLGRLDRSAVPPLIAVLDSADGRLAADAASALGAIGDARAVPSLTPLAATTNLGSPARDAARRAIARLTGRSFDSQSRSPVRVLADEARKYHRHAFLFPGDSALIWEWDAEQKVPVPRQVSRSDAEAFFGQRLAREALKLDPSDVPAQVVLVSQALEKAVEKVGFKAVTSNDPTGAYASALAAGPNVLGQVLQTAITDGKTDLAAVAATALGQISDRDVLTSGRRVHPLVEALSSSGRRAQFAAARALVLLEPQRPFAGSSQVVPILARFVANQPAPRAVVIDGNLDRGNLLASHLKALGYDPQVARTGADGFRAASDGADVELILIDTHQVGGPWRLVDILANLRADARTAGIPIYVVGPLGNQAALDATFKNYPGVKFLVTPTTPAILERQLGGRPSEFSDQERAAYSTEAAALLAAVASRPGSPFEADLRQAEGALSLALNTPTTNLAAATAMGDVPDAGAQRGLAEVVLDVSKTTALRLAAARQLARSLQRFGPLVSADQEVKLLAALDQEREPALRIALASLIGALRPKPAQAGSRLQRLNPLPAAPAPESVPSPPTPEPAASEPMPAPAEEVPPPADAKP